MQIIAVNKRGRHPGPGRRSCTQDWRWRKVTGVPRFDWRKGGGGRGGHRDTKGKEKGGGWAVGLCRTTRSDTGGKWTIISEVKVTQTWSLCLHRYWPRSCWSPGLWRRAGRCGGSRLLSSSFWARRGEAWPAALVFPGRRRRILNGDRPQITSINMIII